MLRGQSKTTMGSSVLFSKLPFRILQEALIPFPLYPTSLWMCQSTVQTLILVILSRALECQLLQWGSAQV